MRNTFAICAVSIALIPFQSLAADSWSNADVAREAAYLALHVADWKQTRTASEQPERYQEQNPILGEYPSIKRVDTYFAVTALLHVGAVHVLPARWRPAFQYFWIGVEAGVVTKNYKIGLRFNN
jgi:hypothetical protein